MRFRLLVLICFMPPSIAHAQEVPITRVDYENGWGISYKNSAQYYGLNESFKQALNAAVSDARQSDLRVKVLSMYRPQFYQDQMRIHRIRIDHPTPIAEKSHHTSRQAVDISFDPQQGQKWDVILRYHGLYRPLPRRDKNHIIWMSGVKKPYAELNVPYQNAGDWSTQYMRELDWSPQELHDRDYWQSLHEAFEHRNSQRTIFAKIWPTIDIIETQRQRNWEAQFDFDISDFERPDFD